MDDSGNVKTALVILLGFSSVALFIYQTFIWLQTGVWPAIHVYDVLFLVYGPKALAQSWLYAPDSWLGLHKIVKSIIEEELAVILLLIAGISAWLPGEVAWWLAVVAVCGWVLW